MFASPAPRFRALAFTATVCITALAVGCAHSEYDLEQPSDLARHIGAKTVTVPWAPLEYRFTAVEDHLVVRIYNRTDEPVHLLGVPSVVVDPKGQSHSIGGRTIAPRSYIKMVLPPLRVIVGPVGPTVGFGFGFGGGYWHRGFGYRYGYFYDDPFFYGPPDPGYYEVYDDGQGSSWRWPDGGAVRLVLVYQRGVRPPAVPVGAVPASAPAGPMEPTPSTTAPLPPGAGGPADTFTQEFVFRQRKA